MTNIEMELEKFDTQITRFGAGADPTGVCVDNETYPTLIRVYDDWENIYIPVTSLEELNKALASAELAEAEMDEEGDEFIEQGGDTAARQNYILFWQTCVDFAVPDPEGEE